MNGINIKTFKKWHNKIPDKFIKIDLPITKLYTDLGYIDNIVYVSNKYDGKYRKYIHTFNKMPHMFINEYENMLVIYPVKISFRGIIS